VFLVLTARRSMSDRRSCRWVQRSDLVAGEAGSTWHGPVQGRFANVHSWAKIISWQAVRLLLSCRLPVRVSTVLCILCQVYVLFMLQL